MNMADHSTGAAPAPVKANPRKRADGQITGLAGELFVAAELLKRGLQTSITFGNAKSIDLLAYHPNTGRSFTVQVKALRSKNFFPISHRKVNANHVYVFTVLNAPGTAVDYYIVPGEILVTQPERFERWFVELKFPGIHPKALNDFADAWHVFDEGIPTSALAFNAASPQTI